MKPRILFLNLNYSNLLQLKKILIDNDFEVSLEKNKRNAVVQLNKKSFDLCVIDANINHRRNLLTLKEIKKTDPAIVVFFLYHKLSKDKMIELYKAGTFDFFFKPVDLDIFFIKMKNLVRKKYNLDDVDSILTFGLFSLNDKYRLLSFKGTNCVKLTPKECELLKLLITIDDEFVSRNIALKQIWKKDNYFTGKSMDVYITRLRKLLSLDENISIINIRESGFKLLIK